MACFSVTVSWNARTFFILLLGILLVFFALFFWQFNGTCKDEYFQGIIFIVFQPGSILYKSDSNYHG